MRRPSPFLWLLLGILGTALVLLIFRQDEGTVLGLESGRFAQLAVLVAILAFFIVGAIGRGNFGRMARYALIWAVIVGVLLVGYTYRNEIGDVAQRVMAEIVPGQPAVVADTKSNTVIINRGRGSTHFVAVTEINNAPIEMLVDTGASVITLTTEDARLAGIETRRLRYDVTVATANGMALAAPVTLDRVAIRSIELNRVVALVAEEGALEVSLLGLNFLNALSSYTVAGDQLILVP